MAPAFPRTKTRLPRYPRWTAATAMMLGACTQFQPSSRNGNKDAGVVAALLPSTAPCTPAVAQVVATRPTSQAEVDVPEIAAPAPPTPTPAESAKPKPVKRPAQGMPRGMMASPWDDSKDLHPRTVSPDRHATIESPTRQRSPCDLDCR